MDLSVQIDAVYKRALLLQQRAADLQVDPELLDKSIEELHFVLEELQTSQEELQHQNEALIAAQQRTELERKRYQMLYELAPDGYLVTDAQGKIYKANRAAAALFSMPQEFLINKPLVVLIYEADRPRFLTRLANLEQPQDWEISLNSRNGAVRSIAVSVTQMEEGYGDKGTLLWSLRDITLRKQYIQAEQKVREQAALIDIATDAIFVQDLDYRILFWSKGAERLYGWTQAEILDKKVDKLFSREFSVVSELEAGLNQALELGGWHEELLQVTKAGRSIIVESRWTLVHNDDGRPKSILVVNTDITETKHLELQRSSDQILLNGWKALACSQAILPQTLLNFLLPSGQLLES
jgi:two-component system, cell cycle sensor histidine kinase and response regulator CckA